MGFLTTLSLALGTAVLYMAATVILKLWGTFPAGAAAIAILVALGMGCAFEAEALRRARLAEVVILILAFEVGIAAVLAHFAFGESYSLREVAGLGVIVLGVGLLATAPTRLDGPPGEADFQTPSVAKEVSMELDTDQGAMATKLVALPASAKEGESAWISTLR